MENTYNPSYWQAISKLRNLVKDDKDRIALNVILDQAKKQSEKVVKENLLFAKLYAILLEMFVPNYGSVNFSIKQINNKLKEPLQLHLSKLLVQLKINELDKYCKSKGITDYKDYNHTPERLKQCLPFLNIKEMFESYDEYDENIVNTLFEKTINLSINEFKNLP
jgi:hypothetical protein